MVPATVKRSGLAVRMILDTGRAATAGAPDVRLIGTIAKAHRWWQRLLEDPRTTITDLARAEGVTSSYVTRILRLAFLDPAIATKIVNGKAPAYIDLKRLVQTDAIAARWASHLAADRGYRSRSSAPIRRSSGRPLRSEHPRPPPNSPNPVLRKKASEKRAAESAFSGDGHRHGSAQDRARNARPCRIISMTWLCVAVIVVQG
ncbi:hypothetical protein CLG96_16525 [Sphingomonas oleivorans]|uniref:Uncharacterized protein n=2 Tax=Sphingomonas oleivorans TaxID=1735121 RepID=A0A2T5FTZ7_9SPHN|nr:hypothetical protein CLG96_16525 [Sphingomonas oleivorans]